MMSHQLQKMIKYFALCTAFLFITVMFGCSGDNGTSVGTIAGQVTDNFGNKVAGAKITPTPLPQGSAAVTTDANGNYAITLPNGSYSFAYAQTGYASQTKS